MRPSRTFVVLRGGLGNQLFQFAAAASVCGSSGVRVRATRTTPHLDLAELMPGLAKEWNRVDRWRLGCPFDSATGWRRFVEIALKPIRLAVRRRTVADYGDLADAFAPRPLHPARPLVLDGYFQHPDWYEGVLPEVVDLLLAAGPPEQSAVDHEPEGFTVLHVRGGDYRNLGWGLDVGYYERALSLLGEPTRVHVVTDDREAGDEVAAMCVRLGWKCTIGSSHRTAADDFWIVAAARRLVMSNSTFCWWAAQVGDARWGFGSSDRVVVFPDYWVLGNGGHLRNDAWIGLA